MTLAAAGCFAGLVLLIGAPGAIAAETFERPARAAHRAAAALTEATDVTSHRPVAVFAQSTITVTLRPLELKALAPEAFADWAIADWDRAAR